MPYSDVTREHSRRRQKQFGGSKNFPEYFSLAQIWRNYNARAHLTLCKNWSLCSKFWRNSKLFQAKKTCRKKGVHWQIPPEFPKRTPKLFLICPSSPRLGGPQGRMYVEADSPSASFEGESTHFALFYKRFLSRILNQYNYAF